MEVKNGTAGYMQLLLSFGEVQKNILRLIQKSATEKGVSIPQYSILMTLFRCSGMTQKAIAEKTFLPKSTLSQAVDGLAKEGYVTRRPMECDRREIRLELSGTGLALAEQLHLQEGGLHQAFKAASSHLTNSQIEELVAAHKNISSYLSEAEMEGAVK
ncbi:MarR family transcriptional regulator [Planococcus sp. A6]|uniref:MarR family winged helix-turn-helix transcriptional regulator n=1 Tax=Planococcus sp. A6 TaxID=2992760 RepID=UPI00237BAA92|nr:MarR family transcriptional regulator [Planococcus sp. A6]MDE0582476.1 MarR family transcriptional regulator [Planococcus sp. A6]